MADISACPLCGQHPAADGYCTIRRALIPRLRRPGRPCDELTVELSTAGIPATEPATIRLPDGLAACTVCGHLASRFEACPRCGSLPPASQQVTARHVLLVLPGGAQVSIPCGQEIVIGRNSDHPSIRHHLAPFDVVSRRHCLVVVDISGAKATIRDLGSANGTWINAEPARLGSNENRTAPLPVQLRLGRQLFITIGG